jgi:hypothetical protein
MSKGIGENTSKSNNPASPSEQIAGWLVLAFLLTLSLSPRMPLDLSVGRAVDYRLNELLLAPMAALAAYMGMRKGFRMRSPWHPFLLAGFAAASAVTVYTIAMHQDSSLLILGHAYRFLVYFLIVLVVAVLRSSTGPRCDRFVIAAVFIAFAINSVFGAAQRLRGETAVYTNSSSGLEIKMYGSGLLGEQNPLSSGLFFVFVLVVLGALLKTRSLRLIAYIPLATVCVVSLVLVTNRSAFASAAVVLVATLWSSLPRGRLRALITTAALATTALAAVLVSDHVRLDTYSIDLAAAVRLELWATSWNLLMEVPLSGWGLGLGSDPHQAYLGILGEFGILAGAVLLAMFASNLLTRLPSRESLQDEAPFGYFQADWSWAFRVFLLSLLVAGLLTDSLTPVHPWQLLAFLAGLSWGAWAKSGTAEKRVV